MESKEKLKLLKEKIGSLKEKKVNKPVNPKDASKLYNILIQFCAFIIVGIALGIMLDKLLNTKPWLLLFCLTLSSIAALKTIFEMK